MKTTRKGFLAGVASCALAPAFAAGRPLRTPLLLDVKRMAIWDGPGMRTTFFVKGCPLKCLWCHNPESIDPKPQLARFRHKCVRHKVCTNDEATCPTGALKFYGKPMTMERIVELALEDRPFYERTGGGVTLSGGEPLFFWEWAAELFARFRAAGLRTCLDTSLHAPPAAIEAMLPVTDMWLPDYKAHGADLHRRCTGVSNELILRNLARLVAAKAKMEVRLLVVPNLTDGADLAARHRDLDGMGIAKDARVELEYNDYARAKYLALGLPDVMPPKKVAVRLP